MGVIARRAAERLEAGARDLPLLILDTMSVVAAFVLSLVVRFDGAVPARYWSRMKWFLPVAVIVFLASNAALGLYGRMWRHASALEARLVVVAGLVGAVVISVIARVPTASPLLPRSVLLSAIALSIGGGGVVRLQARLFGLQRRRAERPRVRALIIGAGEAGAMIVADVQRERQLGIEVVGFLDDDPRLHGRLLRGLPVLGHTASLPRLVDRLQVDQVLLAIPSASSGLIREIATLCERVDVGLRVLPSMQEMVGGRVGLGDLRDLEIEDLLGRQQVRFDEDHVRSLIAGRTVLVTGAGGSIGAELANQIAAFEPGTLLLLDNDETHLFDAEAGLPPGTPAVVTILADIRDRARLHDLLHRHRPDLVFHAAALKHVPVLERFPREAFATNVLGTAHLVGGAVEAGVQRFILVSTDKAVRPTSVMGGSKRVAEAIVTGADRPGAVFASVRFGNVLGSRGSVVPTFLRQIERGGPVTVTDPAMTRYFMSGREAVALILQAAALAEGGEVLTLDMGEPVNILDLAKRLIRLSGRVPGRDVHIAVTGIRPGEKLHEDLADGQDEYLPSAHPGISISRRPEVDPAALRVFMRELERIAAAGSERVLAQRLRGSDDLLHQRVHAVVTLGDAADPAATDQIEAGVVSGQGA